MYKILYKITNILLLLFFVFEVSAQPGNDLCDDAEILCLGVPSMGSNAGANPECSGAGCTWPGCFRVHNSVWYKFTTNSTGGTVNVTITPTGCLPGSTNRLQGVIISGGCGSTTRVGNCQAGSAGTFTLTANGLPPNTMFWVVLDGDAFPVNAAQCSFNIVANGAVSNCNCQAEAGTLSVTDKCPGQSFTVAASGFNNSTGFTQTYIMTNSSGEIISISSSGSFTAPTTCGTYEIHSYNYDSNSPGVQLPALGDNVSSLVCAVAPTIDPCCDRETEVFNVAATVVQPPPGGSTVSCPSQMVLPVPPAITNSCGQLLSRSAPVEEGNPACSGEKTYTWTYTDMCNNITFPYVYTYTLSQPTVVLPPNVTTNIPCPTVTTAPTPPNIQDNCGRMLSRIGPTETPDPTCSGNKTYSWIYTDCNNENYTWQHEYVVISPQVTMPANITTTIPCPAAIIEPTPPNIMDNCGRMLSRTGPEITPFPITCAGTQNFVWTYTDCNNVTYLWQYSYVISNPIAIIPANTSSTVSCVDDIVVPTPPSINDNCGNPLNISGPTISGPVCGGAQLYTFTYTDCSNRAYNWTHTFNISAPVIVLPPNESSTVPCINDIVVPTPPSNIMDNCGNMLTLTGPFENTDPLCGGTKTFTWTYTDCANNSFNWVYTYTINAPISGIIPPNDALTIPCLSDAITPDSPDVINSCGDIMQKIGPVVSTSPICGGNITYTWTYLSCTGQQYTWVFTYTVEQPSAGTLPPDGTATVDCISNATPPTPPNIEDSCGRPMTISGPTVSPNPTCGGTITYTWTYTTCNGSTLLWSFIYTIPQPIITLDCPTDITICQDQSRVYTIPNANAFSNCSNNINMNYLVTGVTNRSGVGGDASGIFNVGVSTITWFTTNTCGNTASCITNVDIKPTPTLALVSAQCELSLSTYSVTFAASGGDISVISAGLVNGNTITEIPVGVSIIITADEDGCITQLPILAPNCDCPNIPVPTGISYEICADEDIVEFLANLPNPYEVRWYSTATGGIPIATGSIFLPSGSGTWYAEGFDPTTMCFSLTRRAFTLQINPLPNIPINGPSSICSTDTLILIAAGGVNYEWSNGNMNQQLIIIGSPPGSYTFTVTVTNANGCANTNEHTIEVSQQPSLNVIDVTCSTDLKTYSILFTAMGGAITSSHGIITGNAIIDIDTSVVTVIITVTNPTNNMCSVSQTILRPNCRCPNLEAPVGSQQTICSQSTSMTPFVANVVTGMQVNWYGSLIGGTALLTNSMSFVPSPIPNINTTYYAANFDPITKCESSRTPFILTVNPTPQAAKPNDIKVCGGQAIPAITFAGGSADTVYSWQNDNTSIGLPSSGIQMIPTWMAPLVQNTTSSTITVTPSLGLCQGNPQTFNVVIDVKPTIEISNVSCASDLKTYSISFAATGGTVTSSAGIINGNQISEIDTSIALVNLTITNPDNNSCNLTIPVFRPNCNCPSINPPTGVGLSFCDKSLTIDPLVATVESDLQVRWYSNISGGIPILSNSPRFTPNPIPVETITYYAAAYDPLSGCESSRTPFKVTVNPLPDITITGDSRVCKNASVNLATSGGTSYIWSENGGNQSLAIYTNMQSTKTYIVTVTSINDCSNTQSITVQVDELPDLKVMTECGPGENSGIINIVASSGSGGVIRYLLNGTDIGSQSKINNLTNDKYLIKVVEQNSGCEVDTTVTISCGCVPITITGDSIICQNSIRTFQHDNGNTGLWNVLPTSAGTIDANGIFYASSTFNGIATIEFLSNGCLGTKTIDIVKNISANIDGISPLCFGKNDGQISITNIQGGKPKITFLLDDVATNVPIQNLAAGTYTVEIVDSFGCSFLKDVSLNEPEAWEIVSITADKTSVYPNEEVSLSAEVSIDQSNIKDISWTPTSGLSCPTCLVTLAKPLQTTTYQLLVTDQNECTMSKNITINIKTLITSFPNIINPNSNIENSVFYVKGNQDFIDGVEQMMIYDRWGNNVFSIENTEINDPIKGWNGTFNGGDIVPGVFVYFIKLKFKNGSSKEYVGDVLVVK